MYLTWSPVTYFSHHLYTHVSINLSTNVSHMVTCNLLFLSLIYTPINLPINLSINVGHMGNMYGAGPGFAYGNMGQPQWGKTQPLMITHPLMITTTRSIIIITAHSPLRSIRVYIYSYLPPLIHYTLLFSTLSFPYSRISVYSRISLIFTPSLL